VDERFGGPSATNTTGNKVLPSSNFKLEDDIVNHPSHYQLRNGIEVIDVIRGALTPEQYRGYCKGNLIKYILRSGKKDDEVQDLNKGDMYLKWLVNELEAK